MILHFYSGFRLCVPEQFAKLPLLYQLLCTYGLKKHGERRRCVLRASCPEQAAAFPSSVVGIAELYR